MTKIIYEPSIFLISRSSFSVHEVGSFFNSIGVDASKESSARELIWTKSTASNLIEFAGRMCYQSWEKGRNQKEFIRHILEVGHGNLLAHVNVTLAISGVSRSLSHELIRHHVGTNPSQESQRYVNQETANLVMPVLAIGNKEMEGEIVGAFYHAEKIYRNLKDNLKGKFPELPATERRKRINEFARAVLPSCVETRICWTMNLRAARNILEQRGDQGADLEIRRFAVAVLRLLQPVYPDVFYDFSIEKDSLGFEYLKFKHRKV